MVSSAKRTAIKIYQQEKCDRLTADVPKGKREQYRAKAASLGISLAALIQTSIESYGVPAGEIPAGISTTAPAEKITAEQRRLIDATDDLTPNERRALLKFLELLKARADS